MKTQWNIFIAFFRTGMLGFGGGPASIPLFQKEVVGNFKWMTEEEFGEVLAIGNTLPGPIATKMAGYIGYRVSGIWGMINAVLANILPTIILMTVLLTFLSNLRDFDWVQGMTAAVVPIVGMMMGVLTKQFIDKSVKGLGVRFSLVLGVIVLIAMYIASIHPGIIIGVLLGYSLFKKDKKNNKNEGKRS
ncbi:chromate transporter [Oceanobacillus piezotolerans]|uniref:Chromate transporter n=1 Tax=Oceanobacillus piezotolerans TaxID=2448030 RepID=A0A498DAR3_9BACI|nr:chromate transporter [Oceanobacillus piezotolerans]RLL44843.1 chromate transporter [Oceanobacillus piezotolerans]